MALTFIVHTPFATSTYANPERAVQAMRLGAALEGASAAHPGDQKCGCCAPAEFAGHSAYGCLLRVQAHGECLRECVGCVCHTKGR